jgi:hypothetical protein
VAFRVQSHKPAFAGENEALAQFCPWLAYCGHSTVNSLIIENSTPIENGDFERFLAFRLARIGIFL